MKIRTAAIMMICALLVGFASACASEVKDGIENNPIVKEIDETRNGEIWAGSDELLSNSTMSLISENEFLKLYADEKTAMAAVQEKRNGHIWYTNPPDFADDKVAAGTNADNLKSQLSMVYSTDDLKEEILTSYRDSIYLNQFKIYKNPDGMTVDYRIGKEKKIFLAPQIISGERFDEMILGKISDEKLKKTLINSYQFFSLKNITSKDRKNELLAKYPVLNKYDIYVLYAKQDYILEDVETAIKTSGYTIEDLAEDNLQNDVKQDIAESLLFRIPLKYTLEGSNLIVSIDTAQIEQPSIAYLYKLNMLEFFGAAGIGHNGYMFIPDGSGAIIKLDNDNGKHQKFVMDLYGRDPSLRNDSSKGLNEQAYLPVFGIKNDDNAFLGIITEGDSQAYLSTQVSKISSSYNTINPGFVMTQKEVLDFQESTNSKINIHEKSPLTGNIKVIYSFLSGDAANYTGMAKAYREHLIKTGQLPATTIDNKYILNLDLIGAIQKRVSPLGIPYNSIKSLTTFDEAQKIIDRLIDQDVKNINLKYIGWNGGGIDHNRAIKLKPENKLGGRKGLDDLLEYVVDKNIDIFFDVDTQFLRKKTFNFNFSENSDSARGLNREIATSRKFSLATGNYDENRIVTYYILSANKFVELFNGLMNGFNKLDAENISLRTAGNYLASDFNTKKPVNRQVTEQKTIDELAKLKNGGKKLMFNGGNAYILPFASYISNMSLYDSGYSCTYQGIPFYQIVIHGYIPYSGKPLNLAPDYKKELLYCIETGASLHYQWTWEDETIVKETEYSYLYATHYIDFIDQAISDYLKLSKDLQNVFNVPISGHQYLQNGVARVQYENGVSVIVNHNSEPVTIDGKMIGAENYLVDNGGVNQ